MGITILGFTEREVWRMTPYKILTLFSIHREFNPDKFKPPEDDPPEDLDDIDMALGGFL